MSSENPDRRPPGSGGCWCWRRWRSFMVVLDMLVVATALTAIQRDLGASLEDLEWTVNAYTLSFAVLLMTAAALGDRLGRSRMFAAGLVLFAAASAACALAPSAGALIAARAVQGVGAAMIMPLALALLNAAFPPERRGWAIGVYGSVTGLAAVLGRCWAGWSPRAWRWPWIFWLNVPIGLLAIPLVLARGRGEPRPGGSVDLPGLLLVRLAAARPGVGRWSAATPPAGERAEVGPPRWRAGSLAGWPSSAWERRAPAPMLPLRLFRSRAFSAGNAAIFLLNASMTGRDLLHAAVPAGRARARARSPPGCGCCRGASSPLLLAPRAGALADRMGARPLVVTGLLRRPPGWPGRAGRRAAPVATAALIAPMSVAGIGFALAIPAVTKAAVSTGAPADIGQASGAYSTMRQLGGAFGVAVPAAVFGATGGYASAAAFSDGFSPAIGTAAGLALAGVLVGVLLPSTPRPPRPAPSEAAPVRAEA